MVDHACSAEGGGEQPLPVQLAVRSGQGGVLGPRKGYIRACTEIEKYRTDPGCEGCDAIFTRSTAKNHCTECRENIMADMQHDEKACAKSLSGRGPQETTSERRR